jgi:hypothetical protein
MAPDRTLYPGEGIDAFSILAPDEGGCEAQSGRHTIDTEGAVLLVPSLQTDRFRMLGKNGANGATAPILESGWLAALVSAMSERANRS